MSGILPTLNRQIVQDWSGVDFGVPPELLDLPERAVQFGTGAFLRGFVDALLDEANRRGHFRGRVVAVGSTGSGRERALNAQDGLYTLSLRDLQDGVARRTDRIIASVSRALVATEEWPAVLRVAANPDLELIFSNTTEIGIAMPAGDALEDAPAISFPGKLTRFLFERARVFDYAYQSGVVVLPCELIEDNGDRLKSIVLELARRWQLGPRFDEWLETAVPFCNTLVDRIVPGTPGAGELAALQQQSGFVDHLLTVGEPYQLFAIEADTATRARIRFAADADSVVLADDIAPYRDQKIRLLNGAHTLLAPVGLLCGCRTVHEALDHAYTGAYLRRVLLDELVPSVHRPGAREYAATVIDRLGNSAIEHALADLMLQAAVKWRVRVLPSLQDYARRHGHAPAMIAFGFAAYLLFHRNLTEAAEKDGRLAQDERAAPIAAAWRTAGARADTTDGVVRAICTDTSLWGTDLDGVPGFVKLVSENLTRMLRQGVSGALAAMIDQRAVAAGS